MRKSDLSSFLIFEKVIGKINQSKNGNGAKWNTYFGFFFFPRPAMKDPPRLLISFYPVAK